MQVNRPAFYTSLRTEKLFTTLTQLQVDSIDAILNEAEKQGCSVTQKAYLFATAYHECYNPKDPTTRLTPMREFGGEAYLKKKKYYPYVGMGFSQLTWLENYRKESKRLGLDLIKEPTLILHIPTAANSHVFCMMNGRYTGVGLTKYINDKKTDYVNARRVVNGTDKASVIADYAVRFERALG